MNVIIAKQRINTAAGSLLFVAILYSVFILIGFGLMTGCQQGGDSPIEPQPLPKAQIQWNNEGTRTLVGKIQGQDPEVRLQIERHLGSTNGTVFESASVSGTLDYSNPVLALLKPDVGGTDRFGNPVYKVKSIGSFQYRGTTMEVLNGERIFTDWLQIPPVGLADVSSQTVVRTAEWTLSGYTFSDNKVTMPVQPLITSHQENDVINTASDITVQLDRAAVGGNEETELMFYGNDYRITPVLQTVPAGSTSAQLSGTKVRQYIAQYNEQHVKSPFARWFIAVRVKTAKSVNNNKAVLSAEIGRAHV